MNDDPVDSLFAAPLKDFVAVRNALAAQVKKAGDGARAGEIKAIAKPSPAAWAVNQIARRSPNEVRKLIALSDDLVAAQLKAGGSDESRRHYQEVAAQHRKQVNVLVDLARTVGKDTGQPLRPTILERVSNNLRWAPLADDTRDQLKKGQLLVDLEAQGFSALMDRGEPAKVSRPTGSASASRHTGSHVANREKPSDDRARAAEARAAEARQEAERKTQLREKQAEVARAKKVLERAQAAVAHERTRMESLEASVAKARAQLTEAEQRQESAQADLEEAIAGEEALSDSKRRR